MPSLIKIKRSSVSGNPTTLGNGELAYSALPDNGSNGGDRLYIGMGTEIEGNAANHVVIGGKYFTDLLDHTPGTLTATSAIITDANSKIDQLNVDNLRLDSNTISTTNTNGDLSITPNGSGKLVLSNIHVGNTDTTLLEYIQDSVSGTLVAGEGIDLTYDDVAGSTTISAELASTSNPGVASFSSVDFSVTSGAVELADTVIKGLTVDGAEPVTPSAHLVSITGGEGIDVTALGANITVTGEDATTSNKGIASFDSNDFSVTSGVVSIKTGGIGNTQLENSSITIGSTTVSLGSTSTSLAGLTNFTVDDINVNGNTISTNVTDGSITLAPNGTGSVDVSGKKITNLSSPSANTDAVNKLYVDTVVAEGLHVKDGTDAATATTLAISSVGVVTYDNGTNGVGATLTTTGSFVTIDGVTLDINPTMDPQGGGRVLVKNEVNAAHNGIYYLISATVLKRDPLFDSDPEIQGGDFVFVVAGTNNKSTGWVQSATVNVIGTDPIVFVQFSGVGAYTAGSGLSIDGTEFNINLATNGGIEFSGSNALQIKASLAGNGVTYADGVLNAVGTTNRITVSADAIDIASTYTGQSSITTLGTIGNGIWQGTIVSPTYGGTGVNNGSKTLTLGGNLTTSGSFTTTFTVTDNTAVTLPTSGTLATLTNSETISNKTITNSSIGSTNPSTGAFTSLGASGLVTLTNTTEASAIGTAAVVTSGGLSVAKKIYVGTDIIGAGPTTSKIDEVTIDGGTY